MKSTTNLVLKTFSSLFLTALGLCAAAQSSNVSNESAPIKGTDVITVSNHLYSSIVQWLGQQDSVNIYEYLKKKGHGQNVVKKFRTKYEANLKENHVLNAKSKTQKGKCNCKTIVPSGIFRRTSPVNMPYKQLVDQSPGFLGLNQYSVFGEQINNGLGLKHSFKLAAHDVMNPRKKRFASNGGAIFKILNLCTQKGVRYDLCNCDKILDFNGRYDSFFGENTAETGIISDVSVSFKHLYRIFTAERNVQNNTLYNYKTIDSINDAWTYKEGTDISTHVLGQIVKDWGSIAESLMDVELDSVFYDFGHLISHLDSLVINNIEGSLKPEQQDANSIFGGSFMLRSNIPRVFVAGNTVETAIGGREGDWNAEIKYNTLFSWNFKLPKQSVSYDVKGNLVNSHDPACCNEYYAAWDMMGTTFYKYPTLKQTHLTDINTFLNTFSGGNPNYSVTNKDQSIINNNGFLDIDFDNRGRGMSHSILKCGCDGLITYNNQGVASGLLTPNITLNSSVLCGEYVELNVINLPAFLSRIPNGSAKLIGPTGNIISNFTANPIFITTEGEYQVVFDAGPCQTVKSFDIDTCPNPVDTNVECLDSYTSVFPVPFPANQEFLNMEICAGHCIQDENTASNYFPAGVRLLNFQNGNVYYNQSNAFYFSQIDDLGCITHQIDMTSVSGFPFASGTQLLLQIQLANSDIISRILIIQ